MSIARVLIIAGSDSGGGAGIQGDIKTVTCLGGYATTAITALTAQNTLGVQGIYPIPVSFIADQINSVLSDIGADAIKTGMLHSAEVIEVVAATVQPYLINNIPLIIDPVMVAKGGAPLLQQQAVTALKTKLIPLAYLVTPNIPEAEILAGMPIKTVADMRTAAKKILELGAHAVLIKGGHLEGEVITNLLLKKEEEHVFTTPRIPSNNTHGTGCTLASAIATGLAQKMMLKDAIKRAEEYVSAAIKNAPAIGKGHGPLGHNFSLVK